MQQMMMRCAAMAVGLLLAGQAGALTAAEKCQSSELKTSGKYSFCRLKAEANAVQTGGMPDYSRCETKFADKFGQADTQGMGACPSSASQAQIQTFITQCSDDVASALGGGPLPDCAGDLATCTGSLGTCNTSLGTCTTQPDRPAALVVARARSRAADCPSRRHLRRLADVAQPPRRQPPDAARARPSPGRG